MPVQLLLILTGVFFAFVIGGWMLKKQGRTIPKFWQALLIWGAAYIVLRFVLFPPIPRRC
jgi:hypothetical protein